MRTANLVFVLLLLLIGVIPTRADAVSITKGRGDLDSSGQANTTDVSLIQNCLATPRPAYCTLDKADLNGDDRIDTADVNLLRAIVNSPVTYWAESGVDAAMTYNYSSSSNFRCRDLLVRASKSIMGYSPRSSIPTEAIRKGDMLFCSRFMLAWIDNTGYHGGLNGLFLLNNQSGNALDFILGSDGLPRNILIVGENHDGKFHDGYVGGTHLEVINYRRPAAGQACQPYETYSTWDAGKVNKPNLPWWTACNAGKPAHIALFNPTSINVAADNLKVVHEAELKVAADNTAPFNCENRHKMYMFEDGIRRPVYIRVGWQMFANAPLIYRTMQVRNKAGNPPIPTCDNYHPFPVHSFVISSLTNGPADKQFRNYILPEAGDIRNNVTCGPAVYKKNTWNYNGGPYTCQDDKILNNQSLPAPPVPPYYKMSRVKGIQRGATISLWPDNSLESMRGNGVCDCIAHGGFELSMGTMPDLKGLPGGAMTKEYLTGLYFPGY